MVQPLKRGRSFQTKQPVFAPERSVASAGLAFKRAAEAGITLPRSPRFIWRETKPEAPRMRPSPAPTPCCFSPRARAFTASIVTFGARRPHWREVVLCSSCASERVRRSSQCGGSRNCQSPLQWRRALPCLVKLPEQGVCVGLLLPPWGAAHAELQQLWAVCGAAGCGAHVNRPSDGA